MERGKTARALRLQIAALVALKDPISIRAAEAEIERLIDLLEREPAEVSFAPPHRDGGD
jgi:hypothetical protein